MRIFDTLSSTNGFVSAMGAREMLSMKRWWDRRTELYKVAEARAREIGRPLLVVGRPRNRSHG